jgi:hypothetical protein
MKLSVKKFIGDCGIAFPCQWVSHTVLIAPEKSHHRDSSMFFAREVPLNLGFHRLEEVGRLKTLTGDLEQYLWQGPIDNHLNCAQCLALTYACPENTGFLRDIVRRSDFVSWSVLHPHSR